ncbi:hypothetical protein [Lentzea indica]|uniref:hypothetical protein n=1 Tax=Lentzea indica TaxID=2604800 RepID=UPI001CB71536|nr:hypothetical protein [Lentzea indica]
MAAISRETLRRILRDAGITWQTTTWKASPGSDFIPKMQRILDLYDHPPTDGRVICVDEFGPLNLLPRKGKPGGHRPSRNGCGRPTTATTGACRCSDFDGTERAPMRIAEARITLGVVAARNGDLEGAIEQGRLALNSDRKSLPSLPMVSQDLGTVLAATFPDEAGAQEHREMLRHLTD